jgi:multicomponent Na+:H+ antiporter subunit D
MKALLVLPIVLPLLTAATSLLAWRWRTVQRVLGVIGTASVLALGLVLLQSVWRHGIQSTQMGSWPAPFGITLVADLLSAIMVVLAGLMGLAVAIYSLASIDRQREAFGYYPLLHILLMGVCGAFLTGDIFNLYVWFEVMLIASFVLLALGSERPQIEGAIKYVTLNLMSSALFLAAVGILYGVVGTLNMADLAVKLPEVTPPGLVTTLAMLFLVAFGVKAAVFPLFFWLPASYHTPPVAVSAIFAGLLTKVGVYALIRVFTLLFVQNVGYTHTLILVIAGLSMLTGVLGAVAQNEFRRILSFHIVSQIGYMLMGLGLFTRLALAGSVFYIVHHIIVKTNLFLVSGVAYRLRGTFELKDLGGLYHAHPMLALLFLIPALSLAGIPPLSGFFAKLALLQAGLEMGQYIIVVVALAVGILTLVSMTKIWAEAFWKPAADPPASGIQSSRALLLPIATLATLTVLIGLAAGPLFALSMQTADQLLNPRDYIQAVLGGQP